jgi:hypothetical protein
MMFLIAAVVSIATGQHTLAPPPSQTCAQAWIQSHGKAPSAPVATANPTPAQKSEDAKAQAAWRVAYKSYQTQAAEAGLACVFGGASKAPRPSTPAEAMSLLEHAIGPDTPFVTNPPKDMDEFCPNYAKATSAEKQQVWRNIFLAIIPHESGFKNASMMIDGDEYSIGLYQMSIHNGCAFASEADVGDPAKNTACAVYKMGVLATPGRLKDTAHVRYGLIGGGTGHTRDGAATYWSTLRYKVPKIPAHDTTSRGEILAAARSSPGCR